MKPDPGRKLSETESKKIKKALLEKWSFRFEDTSTFRDLPLVVVVSKDDISEVHYQQIIQLISLYTNHVLELPENGKGREVPVMSFHPDSFETVFCDDTFSWIIYASSGGKLTFAGEWLTTFVEKMFAAKNNRSIPFKNKPG